MYSIVESAGNNSNGDEHEYTLVAKYSHKPQVHKRQATQRLIHIEKEQYQGFAESVMHWWALVLSGHIREIMTEQYISL